MQDLLGDPGRASILRRSLLCRTLAGLPCDVLTVTQFDSPPEELRARRAIVITARVHPGESVASWVMRGFLDFLTSQHPTARMLRANFLFKVGLRGGLGLGLGRACCAPTSSLKVGRAAVGQRRGRARARWGMCRAALP